MAFLDNTGLERLWQHICAKFAPRENTYQLQHPNILGNSDFTKLITYRNDYPVETKEFNTKMSFKFDRWRSSTLVSETGTGTGITLSATTNSKFARIHQGMPSGTIKNIAYTAVLTLTDGTKVGGVIDLSSAGNNETSLTIGDYQFLLQKNVNSTYDRFMLVYKGTAAVIAANIGLYEGVYETLPDYIPKPILEERLHCLRYFRRINSDSLTGRTTTAGLRVDIPIEVALRTSTPSLIIKKNGSLRIDGTIIKADIGNNEKVNVGTPTLNNVNASEIVLVIGSYLQVSSSQLVQVQLSANLAGSWAEGQVGLDADFV